MSTNLTQEKSPRVLSSRHHHHSSSSGGGGSEPIPCTMLKEAFGGDDRSGRMETYSCRTELKAMNRVWSKRV